MGGETSTLIAEGLEAHTTVRELLEHVSEDYRTRLAGAGKRRALAATRSGCPLTPNWTLTPNSPGAISAASGS